MSTYLESGEENPESGSFCRAFNGHSLSGRLGSATVSGRKRRDGLHADMCSKVGSQGRACLRDKNQEGCLGMTWAWRRQHSSPGNRL